jgi:cell division protein FtsL
VLLILLVIGSALGSVYEVFLYRHEFGQLQVVRQDRQSLDEEWGRLLIEQQTFGATAQIGGRAVMSLRMYSPPPAQTVVLTSPAM